MKWYWYREWFAYSSDELFQRSREGYDGVYWWSNKGNIHQNNTRVSAEAVRHESTYIISFLAWHNQSIHDDNRRSLHRPRVSLARFSSCWWHHNRLLMTSQWPDNYDAITWRVISNSLDIGIDTNIEVIVVFINDLGRSPQPEGEARGLWWASHVVDETTMTEIEVSISILSWWN